ncbi:TPA: hypothetical protein ACX6SP_003666 [Photobacterium damselae]
MNKLLKDKINKANTPKSSDSSFKNPERYIWTLNPIFQTCLWIFALLWGASASLKANEIMAFSWPTIDSIINKSPNYYTIGFFLTAFLLTLGFAISSWVGRAQDSIVVESMLTMPPHDFWSFYGNKFTTASQLVDSRTAEILGDTDDKDSSELDTLRQALEKDARTILDQIINLVKKWDASNLRGNSVIYRANVMKVYYFGSNDSELDPNSELAKKLNEHAKKFTQQPFDSHYSGFVSLLDNRYTTTTETELPEPDNGRKPISFPFTKKDNDLLYPIYSNLIGAPKAAATGLASYVPNVSDIVEKYKEKSTVIDKNILNELKTYYSDTSVAASILSIPIKDSESKVAYVVNIYRNQKGLLFDGSKVKDFNEIVKPFTFTLQRLLEAGELFDQMRNKDTDIDTI